MLPLTLSKRVEYVAYDPSTDDNYLGWTKHEIMTNATDLLGNFLLGLHGHPPRAHEASLREVSSAIPPIRTINAARICTANRESGRDACFDEKGAAPTWSGTPDPATVSGDPSSDGQLANEMRIPRPASLEFDGEGLLGGDLPIIVLDFPPSNASDSLWEMTVVPQANDTGREQPVFIRFLHVNSSAARGDARPSTLYFDSYEYSLRQVLLSRHPFDKCWPCLEICRCDGCLNHRYNPSLGCPLGSENPQTLAPDGCASPVHFYTAILDQHLFWTQTWAEEGRMSLHLPSRPQDTDGELLSRQASHGLVLDMITRSDTVWPRYGTSPGTSALRPRGSLPGRTRTL